MSDEPIKQLSTDKTTAAANTAVVQTYTAETGRQHVLAAVLASYSAAPTGGRLTIEDAAGNVVFDADIIAGGLTPFYFDPPLAGSPGAALIITLAAGGGSVVGKLNLRHRVD